MGLEEWTPTEEDIGDYLEAIYDPDFDIDAFEGIREMERET